MGGIGADGSPDCKELEPPVDSRRCEDLRCRDITPVKPAYLCQNIALPRVNELITEHDNS